LPIFYLIPFKLFSVVNTNNPNLSLSILKMSNTLFKIIANAAVVQSLRVASAAADADAGANLLLKCMSATESEMWEFPNAFADIDCQIPEGEVELRVPPHPAGSDFDRTGYIIAPTCIFVPTDFTWDAIDADENSAHFGRPRETTGVSLSVMGSQTHRLENCRYISASESMLPPVGQH
jgi:hypothetical protein